MTKVTDLSTVIVIPIGDTAAAVVCGGVCWHVLLRLYARQIQSNQHYTRGRAIINNKVFAKIRYTWPLFGQNQLQSKNKYKTHARSPAIGQAGIVTDLARKCQVIPVFSYSV